MEVAFRNPKSFSGWCPLFVLQPLIHPLNLALFPSLLLLCLFFYGFVVRFCALLAWLRTECWQVRDGRWLKVLMQPSGSRAPQPEPRAALVYVELLGRQVRPECTAPTCLFCHFYMHRTGQRAAQWSCLSGCCHREQSDSYFRPVPNTTFGLFVQFSFSCTDFLALGSSPREMFIDFRERGRGKKREREKRWCERETLIGCLLHASWPGTKPET